MVFMARSFLSLRLRRIAGGQDDGLVLEIASETLRAELPAESRLLEAAEGRLEIDDHARVDGDAARAHARGDLRAALDVGRPDAAAQAVLRVVGDRDRLLLAAVGDHGQHRPEDLLLRDLHLVVDVREDGRLDEPALRERLRRAAADDRPGAGRLARV